MPTMKVSGDRPVAFAKACRKGPKAPLSSSGLLDNEAIDAASACEASTVLVTTFMSIDTDCELESAAGGETCT